MEEGFKPLDSNDNDVFSLPGDITFKIRKFTQEIHKAFLKNYENFTSELLSQNPNIDPDKLHPNGYHGIVKYWFNEGIDCEILTLGSQSWKKGKVRIKISVEFDIEDDVNTANNHNSEITAPESPLDDLRRKINQGN